MNVSTKGWLERAPDGWRRMTSKQKDLVVRAVHAAMDVARSITGPEEGEQMRLELARCIVVRSLEEYPEDRSCYTCDEHESGYCRVGRQDIPSNVLEGGCSSHRDDGIPF